MNEPEVSRTSRVAAAVSTTAMFALIYLVLFHRSTTPLSAWAGLLVLWIAPTAVIAVKERRG